MIATSTLAHLMLFQTSSSENAAATALAVTMIVIYALVVLGLVAFTIVAYWRITTKAGYQGALSLLMLIPIANLVFLAVFAFSEWPIESEVKLLRSSKGQR